MPGMDLPPAGDARRLELRLGLLGVLVNFHADRDKEKRTAAARGTQLGLSACSIYPKYGLEQSGRKTLPWDARSSCGQGGKRPISQRCQGRQAILLQLAETSLRSG